MAIKRGGGFLYTINYEAKFYLFKISFKDNISECHLSLSRQPVGEKTWNSLRNPNSMPDPYLDLEPQIFITFQKTPVQDLNRKFGYGTEMSLALLEQVNAKSFRGTQTHLVGRGFSQNNQPR